MSSVGKAETPVAGGVEVVPAVGVDPTLLSNIPLFSKLGKSELLALTGLLIAKKFPASTPVMFIGDDGTDAFDGICGDAHGITRQAQLDHQRIAQ